MTYEYENLLKEKGYKAVCGIDEAGRGPLAGPVFAAAVILPDDLGDLGINDSKKLSEKKRDALFDVIKEKAVFFTRQQNGVYYAKRFSEKHLSRPRAVRRQNRYDRRSTVGGSKTCRTLQCRRSPGL